MDAIGELSQRKGRLQRGPLQNEIQLVKIRVARASRAPVVLPLILGSIDVDSALSANLGEWTRSRRTPSRRTATTAPSRSGKRSPCPGPGNENVNNATVSRGKALTATRTEAARRSPPCPCGRAPPPGPNDVLDPAGLGDSCILPCHVPYGGGSLTGDLRAGDRRAALRPVECTGTVSRALPCSNVRSTRMTRGMPRRCAVPEYRTGAWRRSPCSGVPWRDSLPAGPR